MRLDGMAAIVTGGSSGLGAATVRRLTDAGCRVAALDINPGANGIACDVADAASAEAAVAKAREMHGPARILVNCAGVGTAGRIVGRDGPMPLAAFERVIRINLIGSFNLLRLAAADMTALDPLEDGERGVIVNTASIAAYEGQVGQPAYAASKAGVVGMTLPAARELARFGVRVVTIAPGSVPHADGRRTAGGRAAKSGSRHSVPITSRHAGGICCAGRTHRDQPIPERRDDQVGWRAAYAAAVTLHTVIQRLGLIGSSIPDHRHGAVCPHFLLMGSAKTWVAGPSPAMTVGRHIDCPHQPQRVTGCDKSGIWIAPSASAP